MSHETNTHTTTQLPAVILVYKAPLEYTCKVQFVCEAVSVCEYKFSNALPLYTALYSTRVHTQAHAIQRQFLIAYKYIMILML